MFVVLEYREHNELGVGVVHESWLTPTKKEVYWPSYKNQSVFDKAILQGEPIGNKWQLYTVERILGAYDNYKKAQRKAIIAEYTSDLQTDADEEDDPPLNKHRRVNKPSRYLDDADENEETDESSSGEQASGFSRPPLINQSKNKSSTNKPNPPTPLTHQSLGSRFTPTPISTSASSPCSGPQFASTSSRASSSALLEECKTCQTYSAKYLNILSTLIEQNNEILGILRNQSHKLPQLTQSTLGLPVEFPIKSLEDLEVVENYLEAPNKNEKLTAYLASLDKTSLTSSTNAALRFSLSYQVAKELSF